MSRLIVVSNRVSVPKAAGAAGAQGGLAVALNSALREHRGIWFGWSGQETEEFTGHLNMQRINDVTTATIDLEPQDIDEYYNGYANRTLWPLFHYRIDLTEYDRSFGEGYERVNARFATSVIPLIEPDDLVWVHDYHLLPLGSMLRRKGINNRMGIFLHTPWPPTRLLVSLPFHERLVASMLEYDVIGFQTQEWLESFMHYVSKEMGLPVNDDGTIEYQGRKILAKAFPIGVDYDEFVEGARSAEAQEAYDRLKASIRGRKLMIGVDRLDYSKGLGERFESFGRFLTDNPDQAGNVVLLQIAPPSRGDVASYQQIREDLERKTGHINGAHADVAFVPIRYVNRGYPRSHLAGFYRAANIGLVTPLRDGMNLVAKEYVAAQDPEDPGVLILSQFAGAAQQLTEALLVNPHSIEHVSEAIKRALDMPLSERKQRHAKLLASVRDEDVLRWREDFVAALFGQADGNGTNGDKVDEAA
ncbi:alpha,alpha-trehalose-phosphate synthase (UDP-forming) [Novosphingobium pentaromativorans]|uniref:Trehalose-6-phosphate synthase n=1 Tax=Novosphingobium pentaromativorans US6-1 TaxID=1088721 RepID=G6E9Q9_9SPHN|nr:alpha,alpha-trehalose-phosphate synthase (UDP-forming) [Novosphingobium pentaromativorans]AIT80941.1 alpha,alpha-trehalose-phosphate synthase [Novosphingobium pentaromativorans US6-1]EHJ61983.1 alpha,alpha-trehalose-phosphate synthase (UDP-forming) [Novosphingobium pentaromativorans US6-1]